MDNETTVGGYMEWRDFSACFRAYHEGYILTPDEAARIDICKSADRGQPRAITIFLNGDASTSGDITDDKHS